jgi:GNAT superfamily N-acetyltransferase
MKDSIVISADKNSVGPAEAAAIYVELGWGAAKEYSAVRIARSLANCDIVVSARNTSGELIGIARALSDFATTTKILDMLIVPEYQGQGIGMRMMREIESLAKGTDMYGETERKNFPFLEGCGYKKRKGLMVFVKKAC